MIRSLVDRKNALTPQFKKKKKNGQLTKFPFFFYLYLSIVYHNNILLLLLFYNLQILQIRRTNVTYLSTRCRYEQHNIIIIYLLCKIYIQNYYRRFGSLNICYTCLQRGSRIFYFRRYSL